MNPKISDLLRQLWDDPQNRSRIIAGGAGLLVLLILFTTFRLGTVRGRTVAERDWAERDWAERDQVGTLTELTTASSSSSEITGEAATATETVPPLAVVAQQPAADAAPANDVTSAAEAGSEPSTETATPTPTETATTRPSPTPSPTITPTPSATATPASVADWGERFRSRAVEDLNALAAIEFDRDDAATLIRRVAQRYGLLYVPVSHQTLTADTWAVLAIPRTPAGESLPTLFWQDPNDGNRIHGQLLLSELRTLNDTAPATEYLPTEHLRVGLDHALLRMDDQGRFQLLLIEKPESWSLLSIYVLAQAQPGADFSLSWWSVADPIWSIGLDSSYELVETDTALLPNLRISGALTDRGPLRQQLNAPGLFVEQYPFARQQATSEWTPRLAFNVGQTIDAQPDGYRLLQSDLQPTPLTTFARLLQRLQQPNLGEAGALTTRLDVLQQAYDLELSEPALWVGIYLDGAGQPLFDGTITERLRFFDNADRSRTYDAVFESDENNVYRVAALQAVSDAYQAQNLMTPAPAGAVSARAADASAPQAGGNNANESGNNNNTGNGNGNTGQQTTRTPSDLAVVASTATPTVANTPTAAPTNVSTATPTPVPTETPTPTDTPTATDTPLPTATPTETPTPTPAGLPAVLPEIPADLPGIVTGSVAADSPSNLRGGPSIEFVVITQLPGDTPVDYYGITQNGEWVLLRVRDPGGPNDGVTGWMAMNLMRWDTDLGLLPVYNNDGTPLSADTPTVPQPETESPADAPAEPEPADPASGEPTATPSPVAQATVAIRQPASASQTTGATPPAPADSERVGRITGEAIPANLLEPLPLLDGEGNTLQVNLRTASVEIWSGLFGQEDGRWIPAAPELLWAGARVYITMATEADPSAEAVTASRIRIAGMPLLARTQVVSLENIQSAAEGETLMALLGSQDQPGVHMLESVGTLQELFVADQRAAWMSDDPLGGLLLHTEALATNMNSFTWLREDGTGITFFAQPFHEIRGVAGDLQSGIWWIETPQPDVDQWQLWHYDPASTQVALYLQAPGSFFRRAESRASQALIPVLLGVQPIVDANERIQSVGLLVDTVDRLSQLPHGGVFRLEIPAGSFPADPRAVESIVRTLDVLLPPGTYRGTPALSPDGSQLAYFFYEPEQPGLTAGVVTPPNGLRLRVLSGERAGETFGLYEASSQFEFLSTQLSWRGNDRLVLARSRFATDNILDAQMFGLVQLVLPDRTELGATPAQEIAYTFPDEQVLYDFTGCREGEFTLVVMRNAQGGLEVGRWRDESRPRPLFGLPDGVSRAFVCWRSPAPA